VWFEDWNSIQARDDPGWCSAWEAAAEAAWITVWRQAEEEGRLGTQEFTGRPPAPPSIKAPPRYVFLELVKTVVSVLPAKQKPPHEARSKKAQEKEEIDRIIASVPYKLQRSVLQPLADAALQQAKSDPNCVEADLLEEAKRLFNSTNLLDDMPAHVAKIMRTKAWESICISTWERTWRYAWTEAWLAVWDQAGEKARRSGVEEGFTQELNKRGERLWPHDVIAAYNKLRGSFSFDRQWAMSETPAEDQETEENATFSTSPGGYGATSQATPMSADTDVVYCLQQARLAFKELDHLHRILQESTPVPHGDVMRITQNLSGDPEEVREHFLPEELTCN
jgi:hypothetical protein